MIDWPKLIIWTAISAVSLALAILWAFALHDCLAVGENGYTVTGVWRSYPDYRERILWVPGVDAEPCTSGVNHLGGELYKVPEGVGSFRCNERGEP